MPALTYTPTIVVDTTNMDESTWHDYRRKGIGGSDVAAVYGQSPFCTTRDLYYTKIGVKPVIEEEENWVAKKYGHLLEDLVAEIFSQKTGLRVYKKSYLYAHPDYPFMQANVDFSWKCQTDRKRFSNARPVIITAVTSGTTMRFCLTTNCRCVTTWQLQT